MSLPRGFDPMTVQVRRCRHCGGEMRCRNVTQYLRNGGNAGRDYVFACAGCPRSVTARNATRWAINITMLIGGLVLGGMMTYFGTLMLLDTIRHGSGGNSLGAVIVVLVLFLGLGAPFLLGTLWATKWIIGQQRELGRNPPIG